jgi:hypothetical protein
MADEEIRTKQEVRETFESAFIMGSFYLPHSAQKGILVL